MIQNYPLEVAYYVMLVMADPDHVVGGGGGEGGKRENSRLTSPRKMKSGASVTTTATATRTSKNKQTNKQKKIGLINQNKNSAHALHISVHFFAVTALMGRFMEDVNTRRRSFLSLYKLGCGLQKLNSRIFDLHLTFKVSWNNRYV